MNQGNLTLTDVFDKNTPPELREQILQYHMSMVLTDVERARFFGLPSTCRMREGAKIICPENLTCGDHVWIGEGAILDASGGLNIGSHTSIGLSVFVWTHSSAEINRDMANLPHSPNIQRKPSTIGSGCFIAGPTVILPGTIIGDRAIVNPMSVVNRNIDDGEVFSSHRELTREIKKLRKDFSELRSLMNLRRE